MSFGRDLGREEDGETRAIPEGTFVIYAGGIWELVSHYMSPHEDLRPSWGWAPGERIPSTYRIRHRFGPEHPDGHNEVDVEAGSLVFANEMEVLAYAAL